MNRVGIYKQKQGGYEQNSRPHSEPTLPFCLYLFLITIFMLILSKTTSKKNNELSYTYPIHIIVELYISNTYFS